MRHTIKLQQSHAPIRNKVRGAVEGVLMFSVGRIAEAVLSGSALHAWPRAEMAGKAWRTSGRFQPREGTQRDQRKVECLTVRCAQTARWVGVNSHPAGISSEKL
jgi:hypothetical protein